MLSPLEHGFHALQLLPYWVQLSISASFPLFSPLLLSFSSQQFRPTASQEALRQQNSGLGREHPQGRALTSQTVAGKAMCLAPAPPATCQSSMSQLHSLPLSRDRGDGHHYDLQLPGGEVWCSLCAECSSEVTIP